MKQVKHVRTYSYNISVEQMQHQDQTLATMHLGTDETFSTILLQHAPKTRATCAISLQHVQYPRSNLQHQYGSTETYL